MLRASHLEIVFGSSSCVARSVIQVSNYFCKYIIHYWSWLLFSISVNKMGVVQHLKVNGSQRNLALTKEEEKKSTQHCQSSYVNVNLVYKLQELLVLHEFPGSSSVRMRIRKLRKLLTTESIVFKIFSKKHTYLQILLILDMYMRNCWKIFFKFLKRPL